MNGDRQRSFNASELIFLFLYIRYYKVFFPVFYSISNQTSMISDYKVVIRYLFTIHFQQYQFYVKIENLKFEDQLNISDCGNIL